MICWECRSILGVYEYVGSVGVCFGCRGMMGL